MESMWIDVTGYDARTMRGKLVDDPLGATQFNRGDEISRPRSDVEEIEVREPSTIPTTRSLGLMAPERQRQGKTRQRRRPEGADVREKSSLPVPLQSCC